MPVVKTRLGRLISLTGISSVEKLRDILFNLKCETDVEDNGTILIEVQSDRIDMFSVEGIAYAVRLYTELDKPHILTVKKVFDVYVDPPKKRPFIGIAAVKNVDLDEETLKELIEFQERLHTTYGRGRRKVAIGLHDLAKLPRGPIVYRDVDIDSTTMIPLFNSKHMSIREVLELTEQGKLYGSISLHGNLHPAILVGNEVISLPPVINSDITRLEPTTTDVLIDVTGTDLNAVINVLNSIVHTLSFYGGEVLGANVRYPDKIVTVPNIEGKKLDVDTSFASKWLGLPSEIILTEGVRALQRMGYTIDSIDENRITVIVPMYRVDVLHQVDVIEDIAIGLGYENIGLEFIKPPYTPRKPKRLSRNTIAEVVREVLVGLGYVEINTLTLVPSDILKLTSEEQYPEVVNALSRELNALRNSLLPSLLIVLQNSQYIVQPVKIFEVGEVVERCIGCYNNWRNRLKAAFAIMNSEIRFEEIHADLYVILRELELDKTVKIEHCRYKMFIDSRCGCLKYGEIVVGVIGEVNPEILKVLGIEYPIAMTEIYIDILAEIIRGLNVAKN